MEQGRNKWIRRLVVAAAIVVALAGLDRLWPKPATVVAYQAGVLLRRAEFIPYNEHAALPLLRFAGYRHYAPAQMAMFYLLAWSDEIEANFTRAIIWFRGAESQGYLPTLYHRSWYLKLRGRSLMESVNLSFDLNLEDRRNDRRPVEDHWNDAKIEAFESRITYSVLANLAISAGDPFAPREPEQWWTSLSHDEKQEVRRRLKLIKSTVFSPLPKTYPICRKIRTALYPVISAGLEVSLRCLEWQRRYPESRREWLAFFKCAEKLFPPGSPNGGINGALAILEACRDERFKI